MAIKTVSSKLTQKNIVKTGKNTKHLSVESLIEGATYQSHVREIVKILKIDKSQKMIKLRNISQNCNQFVEFKNIQLVKQF